MAGWKRWPMVAGLVAALCGCAGIIPGGPVEARVDRPAATRPPPAPVPTRRATVAPVPPPVGAARMPTAVLPIPAVPAIERSGESAASVGVLRAPLLPTMESARLRPALTAFRLSCPSLVRRADLSGLTQPGDWDGLCAEAERVTAGGEAAFFARFAPVQVGTGALFATGYYEPELVGSRTRRPGYDVPVYGRPADLVDRDDPATPGRKLRGRMVDGRLTPYATRADIEAGALAGQGLEIAWAADPIEVFFLQIQGSGRLRLPDGQVMRVGYAGQNGHAYTSIGRLLIERGEMQSGQASMQGIVGWMRANPAAGAALMRENESFVFFRELTGPGPLGALGLPVTPRVSVAADPRFTPLGAPVFLSSDRADLQGVWVAQDTGGAIKGANRFDSFWGAGDDARATAGGMSARGTAWLLLPPAAAARLTGGG